MFAKVGTEAWEPCLNPIRYRNNITTYITELTGRTEKEVLPKNKLFWNMQSLRLISPQVSPGLQVVWPLLCIGLTAAMTHAQDSRLQGVVRAAGLLI